MNRHAARRRPFWLLFVLILVVAALLRFWQLSSRPGYDWDESVYAVIGHNVAVGNGIQAKIEYDTPAEPYLYHPPFYFLLLGLWFRVFGDGMTEARALAATGSLVMLVVLGLWLRRMIGDRWALLTMAVIAVDGWMVFTNRVGWIENTMMPLGIVGLWLYWKGLQKQNLALFAGSGVLLGLVTVYKHVGIYFLVAVMIHWLIVRSHRRMHLALIGAAAATMVAYVAGMFIAYGGSYWEESTVQVRRILGLRESRGAVTSLSDVVKPLLDQYKIFVVTLLLVAIAGIWFMVRVFQVVRRRSLAPIGEHTLLFAWAAAALLCFVGMQLKLPHYFLMVFVPMFCYLASELERSVVFDRVRTVRLAGAVFAVIVVANFAVFGLRFVARSDNAIRQTAEWTRANLPSNAKVLTEESIGSAIQQPYCKFGHAHNCATTVEYIITYNTHTQQPPDTPTVNNLLKQSTQLARFTGFKEDIKVYRIQR